MLGWVAVVAAAFVAGTYGTIVGAGGGFLFVPLLLLARPDLSPATITTISLGAVLFNGLSGAFAYARQKRIDYKSGLLFAVATVPTASLGALVVNDIPRRPFQLLFGAFLVLIGVFIFFRKTSTRPRGAFVGGFGTLPRSRVDAKGTAYEWAYSLPLGMGVSLVVGFLAALLGVGGGILLVPVMVTFLAFAAPIATATSTFTLLFTSLSATLTHAAHSDFRGIVTITLLAAAGMVVGAQLGARLSQRMTGRFIVRLLAVALVFVGARLVQSAALP